MELIVILGMWAAALVSALVSYYGSGYLMGGEAWFWNTWMFNRRGPRRKLGTANNRRQA